MRRLKRLLWLLIVIFTLTFFQNCKKEENPIAPSEEITKIPPTTKYITPSDYANYFEGFSNDSTQLLFKTDANSKYDFKTNDIIAISEGSGLLRKITSIQIVNNQLVINTAQGTLEEAIENGTVEYSGALSKQNLQKIEILTNGVQYENKLNKTNETQFDFNINKIVYDADNDTTTTGDQIRLYGTFSFTSDIFVKILVKNLKLQYAKYGFEANNSESLTLEAMIQYNLSKEIEVARVTFTPITIQVGVLPVIIVPDLRIKIGVNGYANAGISTSIQNEFHFEAGSEFTLGNGWQPYKTFTNNFQYNPPSLTANCGAKAYIKPEINMAVYGVLAGYAYGEAYGRLDANLLHNPWWKLYVGYNLGIGARAEILGYGLFDFVIDALISHEQLVAQASIGGTILYSENFDMSTVGVKPSDWVEIHSGDGASQVTSAQCYSLSNSFKIGCLTSKDGRYDRVVALAYTDSIAFEYKFKGDQNTWFRPMAAIRIGAKSLWMAFNPNTGKVQWANGSTYSETATINKGVWYSIRMVYKKSANKANYYLNGNLEGSDFNPGTPPSNSPGEGILLSSGNGGNGLIYFDDLMITAY